MKCHNKNYVYIKYLSKATVLIHSTLCPQSNQQTTRSEFNHNFFFFVVQLYKVTLKYKYEFYKNRVMCYTLFSILHFSFKHVSLTRNGYYSVLSRVVSPFASITFSPSAYTCIVAHAHPQVIYVNNLNFSPYSYNYIYNIYWCL